MNVKPVLRYVRRRLLQSTLVLLLIFLYVWSGRIGEPTPAAYLAALYDAAPDWESDRTHCLVPKVFDLRTWESAPMSPSLRKPLEEVGWEMYEDTLSAGSSVILWRIHEARPAGPMFRFKPVRFEPFSAYLKRYLPGTYHLIGVTWTQTFVGATVHSADNLSVHVVRCWAGECRGLGAASRIHFDGWGGDPNIYDRGEVGTCDGTSPVPPEQPDRWW